MATVFSVRQVGPAECEEERQGADREHALPLLLRNLSEQTERLHVRSRHQPAKHVSAQSSLFHGRSACVR